MGAQLVQANISAGGMPKLPVLSASVTANGLAGDRQRNRKYHGGPDRAVCLYSEELYQWLRENGINVYAGQLGENFTTLGIDLTALAPGDRLAVGPCIIEITKVRTPCSQLAKWDPLLPEFIIGRSGWVARVLVEGTVRPGDAIVRIDAAQFRGDSR